MSEEPKRDRSPNCPKQTLAQAVDMAATLYTKGGKTKLKPLVVASTLGYASLNGAALTSIGALNQYGLLDKDEAGNLAVSGDAIAVLHPKDEHQRLNILQRMALNPKVFRQLYADGFYKCEQEVLSNHLIQSSFSPDSAKKVASVFKANVELAKLDDPSINAMDIMKERQENQPRIAQAGQPGPEKFANLGTEWAKITETLKHHLTNAPAGFSALIKQPLELAVPMGEWIAKIPYPVSKEDFDLFIATLKLWERKLVIAAQPVSKVAFPTEAIWRNAHNDKPVTIVGEMGERDGELYYQSEDGTGIPASQIVFP